MTWLHFLYSAEGILQISANVVVLYCLYPAYKRTKHSGFLYLGFAYLIGTFDSICDQTIGLAHMVGTEYVVYHTERRLTYMVVVVLSLVGTLSLIRSFLTMHESGVMQTPEKGNSLFQKPLAFLSRIFRKMGE